MSRFGGPLPQSAAEVLASLKQARGSAKTLQVTHLRQVVKRLKHETEAIRAVLMEYYTSPQGQQDIKSSVHKHRPVEEIVEMLLAEIEGWDEDGNDRPDRVNKARVG